MQLNVFLKRLALSELSNSSIVDKGEIKPSFIETVMFFLNEGLRKLSTRFDLRRDCLQVCCMKHKELYTLSREHLMLKSLHPNPARYILKEEYYDLYQKYDANSFREELRLPMFVLNDVKDIRFSKHIFDINLIKITGVTDTKGHAFKLNPMGSYEPKDAVFTPKYNVLQIPFADNGLILNVSYQATPDVVDFIEDKEKELPITENLLPALGAYVALNVYNNMNTEGSVANGQKYQAIFDNFIQESIETGVNHQQDTDAITKFSSNGWI